MNDAREMGFLLEVGQLYHPNRKRWPECAQYNFRGQGHELVLFLAGPSPQEVEAARCGKSEFALVVEPPLIVLCYRFGDGIPWSDAPYTYHLVPEAERSLPAEIPQDSELRALLLVVLVDAQTGLVRAIRQVSLSHEFTARLHRAIREQAVSAWNREAYDRALSGLYQRFPTQGLVNRAEVRCYGGD